MLRNRKEQDEPKLTGVNRVADPSKLKLGMFQSLENWIPAKRYKIKKKRGVEALVDSPPTPIIPSNCGVCISAVPGAQDLPVVCCYDSNGYGDLTGNDHGMFAFADTDGSFWHVATFASGFGSGPYPDATPSKTWYLLEPVDPTDTEDCLLQEATEVTLPGGRTADFQSTQTPQGGTCGKADEKCYVLQLTNYNPIFATIDNGPGYADGGGTDNGFTFLGETSGLELLLSSSNNISAQNAWCKFDTFFYAFTGGAAHHLAAWPLGTTHNATYETLEVVMSTALPGWSDGSFGPGTNISMMHATTDYLYVLAHGPWSGGTAHYRIYQLNRSDLTYVQYWSLAGSSDFSAPWGFHVYSDDLIFLITGAPATWTVGYFETAGGTTTVIGTNDSGCTNAGNAVGSAGQHGFYYSNNYFYLSYSGYGVGNTNVLKIGPLLCPGSASIPWETV